MSVSVRFANRAVGSLECCSSMPGTDSEELRLWGRDGHLSIEPHPRVYTLRAIDGLRTAHWHSFGRLPGRARSRAVYLSRLATAIDQDRPPDITGLDGVAVQAFVEAAYRANELGHGVRPQSLVQDTGGEASVATLRWSRSARSRA